MLLPHFDAMVLSCEIGWRKPSQQIYDEITRHLGVAPEQALFVGDRLLEDVFGPRTAGMRTALTLEFRRKDLARAWIQPDMVVERLNDLLKALPQVSGSVAG